MVFGRQMRDFIPSLQHKYEPIKDWSVTQEYRERTLALKRDSDNKKWSQRTRYLEILEVGHLWLYKIKPVTTQPSGTRRA